MTAPLRILLSPPARTELAPAIADILGARAYQLLTVADVAAAACPDVELAFISRDVTGMSSKSVLSDDLQAFYSVLRGAKTLQWVQMHSAGADRPIYPELRARGVSVTNASGANAEVVAQTALAGLLALARHFPLLMAAQQARIWSPLLAQTPRDLAGQTALLVGWGPIGQRLGGFLRMLGLKLIVVRHSLPAIADPGAGIEMRNFSAFNSLLPRADWLLLACPLTEQTRGLVNRAALMALPAGARLINVARGEVVVERDLVNALASGHLGAAFLDVFTHEPLASDSPLWSFDNVMVSPHSAGHSDGNYRRVAEIFLANLARWQSGQPLQNCIA